MAGIIRSKTNPVIFFDISIGSTKLGRLKIQLFADICPKTAENFRQFCTGQFLVNEKPIGYKGSSIHRVAKEFRIQGGDFAKNDGTGCISIYGQKFQDQNFILNHQQAGLLCMANTGKNKNGCQFYITLNKCDWLDGKNVVFGKVIDEVGMQILRKIQATPVNNSSRPKMPIIIDECGQM